MVIKPCEESKELKYLRCLNVRMELSETDKFNYANAEKGFEGEKFLSQLLEKLTIDCFVLNGLLLEHNNQSFQIDHLCIVQDVIYIFDSKNNEGTHYIEGDDRWYKDNGTTLRNPLHQLQRCSDLFKKFIATLRFNNQFPIKSYLVFPNKTFTLLQCSKDLPIIHPTQLNDFLKKLDSKPSKLGPMHQKLADALMANNKTESPYTKIPSYKYEQLKKGINCGGRCTSFMIPKGVSMCVCPVCNRFERVDESVLRLVKEFVLLFPDRKITVSSIFEWCGGVVSRKIIRRVLMCNFKLVGTGKESYYV